MRGLSYSTFNNGNKDGDETPIYGKGDTSPVPVEEEAPWENWKEDRPYSIALTGKAFGKIVKDNIIEGKNTPFIKKVLARTQIYARMSPDDKAALVEALQREGGLVGMCGDGANDCGALKAADVGISLSEAEASIAAPFTSKTPDISCVVKLLREGRCALVTSFQCFKFMALYSMIQFSSVTILYFNSLNLADFQFLYIDLFLILPLSAFMSWTGAYSKLTHHVPTGALMSLSVLTSVIGQVLIQFLAQLTLVLILIEKPWYVAPIINGNTRDDFRAAFNCMCNSTVFIYANVQYLACCVSFSISKPFRKPIYTNYFFVGWLLLMLGLSYYIIYGPFAWFAGMLTLHYLPLDWKHVIVIASIGNAVVTYVYEKVLVQKVTDFKNKKKREQAFRESIKY